MKIAYSLTELIGHTPLLEVCNIEHAEALKGRVLVKIEAFNPGGSIKDRAALAMIETAEQARLLLEEEAPQANVHVFNSCSAASGELLVAMAIHRLASAGMPFKRVVTEVEQFIYQMQTMFVLESLENLRKNGRLTKLQSVITGALKIKLFMGATPEGEICKLGQALTVKQALSKMVDKIAADAAHVGRTLAICHCNCLERAFQVKAMLEAKCKFAHIIITEAGGVTSVYAYDGGIVVAY